MKIASLRNSSFTRSTFSRIKINKLPELEKNTAEGYEHQFGKIIVPFEDDESINSYVTKEIYMIKICT